MLFCSPLSLFVATAIAAPVTDVTVAVTAVLAL